MIAVLPSIQGGVTPDIYVAPDGSGDHTTIQSAIDAAATDDVIWVRNGTYNEHLVINKRIVLVGESHHSVIVDGGGASLDTARITTNGVHVENIQFTGSGSSHSGLKLSSSYNKIRGNMFRGNNIGIIQTGNGNQVTFNIFTENSYGIQIGSAFADEIHYNSFDGNSLYGIYKAGGDDNDASYNWWGDALGPGNANGGTGDNVQPIIKFDYDEWLQVPFGQNVLNERTGLRFSYLQDAVNHSQAGDVLILENGTYYEDVTVDRPLTIRGRSNTKTTMGGYGHGSAFSVVSDGVVIEDLHFSYHGFGMSLAGIFVQGSDPLIRNCTFGAVNYGIYMDAAEGVVVQNSTFTGAGTGIMMDFDSTGNIVENTTMTGMTQKAVYIIGSSDNTITGNTITGNNDGVVISQSTGNDVIGNTLTGNTGYGMYVSGGSDNVATDNWWGHHGGPTDPEGNPDGAGDAAAGDITFSGWKRGNVIVAKDGSGDFTGIYDAINASSAGDSIFVTNGTYHEQIVVAKEVILVGEDPTGTIISLGTDRDILTIDVDGVTIEDLGFVGGYHAVKVEGAGVTISGCRFTDHRFGGVYSSDEGTVVRDSYFTSTGDNSHGVVSMGSDAIIEDNIFQDLFSGAMDLGGVNAIVRGNTVGNSGLGASVTISGSHVLVESNTILSAALAFDVLSTHNITFRLNDVTGALNGIVLSGSVDVLIEKNDLHGNTAVVDVSGTNTNVTIQENNIEDNSGNAVENTGTSQVDARNNWWGGEAGPDGVHTGGSIVGDVLYTPWLTQRFSNHAPIIETISIPDAVEDEPYDIPFVALDEDLDEFTWTLSGAGDWLTMDPVLGTVSGTPRNADVGAYTLTVNVSDGVGGYDQVTVSLNVTNVNDAPLVEEVLGIDTGEDALMRYTFTAIDVDVPGQTVTWEFPTLPDWLTGGEENGTVWGTPTNDHVGEHLLQVVATDGVDPASVMNVTVTVVNTPPEILPLPEGYDLVMEDEPYRVDLSSTDDGEVFTSWIGESNATGLIIGLPDGLIAWDPRDDDVGFYWVNVTYNDTHGGTDRVNFTFEVRNAPPTILSDDILVAIEDRSYHRRYTSSDDEFGTTWTMDTNASWLTFDDSIAQVEGTPTDTDRGWFWVNISVSDSVGAMSYTNFTLTVVNTNDIPLIETVDVPSVLEDEYYEVAYTVLDADTAQELLEWTFDSDATWLEYGAVNHTIYGTPVQDDVGIYYVNITIIDDVGAGAFTNFSLTVINVDDPPVITPTSRQVIDFYLDEDLSFFLPIVATDVDTYPEDLLWTLEMDTDPEWLAITPVTGIITGTPTNDLVGVHAVTVRVYDVSDNYDEFSFTVTVNNTNDAPVLIGTDIVIQALEDANYLVNLSATDMDVTDDTQDAPLLWNLTTDAGWLSMDPVTHTLSGIPLQEDVGQYNVTVRVEDDEGAFDDVTFPLEVVNVNDRPVFDGPVDDVVATEDVPGSVTFTASDPDHIASELTWSMDSNQDLGVLCPIPDWTSLDTTTGTLTYTAPNIPSGCLEFVIRVEDPTGAFDESSFDLTIVNVNDPPIITTTSLPDAGVGLEYLGQMEAEDIDPTQDTLAWAIVAGPDWLTIDPISGLLSGEPEADDLGDGTVTISVSDGNGGTDQETLDITVVTPVTLDTTQAGTLYERSFLSPSIPDEATWTITTDADWITVVDATASLSGTPVAADIGSYWIRAEVTLNDYVTVSYFTIEVIEAISDIDPPAVPTFITGQTTDVDGSYELVWAPSARATTYILYENGVVIYNGTGTTKMVTGKANALYTYTIQAWNEGGTSGVSQVLIKVQITEDGGDDLTPGGDTKGEDRGTPFPGTMLILVGLFVAMVVRGRAYDK